MDYNQFEIERDVNDVDIIEIFLCLKEKVMKSNILIKGAKPAELIERWEDVIRNYCEMYEINFEASLAKGKLLVPNDHDFYTIAMVLKLQAIDGFKIPLFLDHQKGLDLNKAGFIGHVEFIVLNSFNNNAPFKDAPEKLDKISAWISAARSKLKAKEVKVKTDYIGLFKDKDFPKKLRAILELNKILIDDVWVGKSKHKTEINILILVLNDKGYLKDNHETVIGTLFWKEFGITLDKSSIGNVPKDDKGAQIAYQKMIPDLFEEEKCLY